MATETLRPNAVGDEENLTGAGDNYTLVDEAVADDGTTIVEGSGETYDRDLYNIDNSGVGAGTINHITVYARCDGEANPNQPSLKICIKSDSTVTEDEKTITATWADYSKQWTTNPADAGAWSWADINALQIGVALRECQEGEGAASYCTQMYVVVDYTAVAVGIGAFYQRRNPFGFNIQSAGVG